MKSLTIQNPTSLPARASAWVIENPGSGNSKRGTANHRKRRRGAKERAGGSLLATSSTENAEVIDLTSNNNTDIPVFAKRWYKHWSSHADGPPPKTRPPTKRLCGPQAKRKLSQQTVVQDLEGPHGGGGLREFSITDIVLPVSFSNRQRYWEGQELGPELGDEKIMKMLSKGWSEATIKTMSSKTRWPVDFRWNFISEVFEGVDYCHNVKYYVVWEYMDRKLRRI